MASASDVLVWMDMEMTGLEPDKERIIEVATILTDGNLVEIATGPELVIHQSDELLDGMDDWNKNTHARSGLIDKVKASVLTETAAEEQLLAFLAQHVPGKTSPMCGNSICQDRRFLARYMPRLEAYFHYRNLDVSTLKELAPGAPNFAALINPNNAGARYSRGLTYSNEGNWDQAIEDYDAAIKLNPNDVRIFSNRGNAYLAKRQYDRAIEDYDRAIALDPSEAIPFNNRGSAYYKKGQSDRAMQDFDRAIELDPNYPDALNNRGLAYTGKGQYDRAIQDFDRALRLDPKDADAIRYRAEAIAKKNN